MEFCHEFEAKQCTYKICPTCSLYIVAACLKQCIVGVGCLTVIIGTVGTEEDSRF